MARYSASGPLKDADQMRTAVTPRPYLLASASLRRAGKSSSGSGRVV